MSDNIYENQDVFNTTTPSSSTAENIVMIEVPKGSQQQTEHGKTQDNSGGHCRRYKLSVVCVLLLAVTIAFFITSLKIQQYIKTTAKKMQLETKFNAERDELQRRLCALESDDMKSIKSHAVNVILDPDTAHPNLIVSADGKQVKLGDKRQNLPDTPKRFNQVISVLGREGFSSGKFYYEVQVKGNTEWVIGVAKESINRKGQIIFSPKYGYWTIWLRDGIYKALDYPYVTLSLKGKLQRVGVFVDYDAGLVSFYDADCWDNIYLFTNASFTEKIYPYFLPSYSAGGEKSAPLVISPVHVCPIN